MRIFVVDDETAIVQTVTQYLEREGMIAKGITSSIQALRCLQQETWDCVVLDWMMPEMNGLEFLRELRKTSEVPILFLTAKGEELDKILALEMGADDYLTKPFSLRELVTRIRVILRRVQPNRISPQAEQEEQMDQYEDLILYPERHQCYLKQQLIPLTTTEFKILHTLVQRPGRVYSRAQLVELAIGMEYIGYERSIDTHILNIRKKCRAVESDFQAIKTIFGIGYSMRETP